MPKVMPTYRGVYVMPTDATPIVVMPTVATHNVVMLTVAMPTVTILYKNLAQGVLLRDRYSTRQS